MTCATKRAIACIQLSQKRWRLAELIEEYGEELVSRRRTEMSGADEDMNSLNPFAARVGQLCATWTSESLPKPVPYELASGSKIILEVILASKIRDYEIYRSAPEQSTRVKLGKIVLKRHLRELSWALDLLLQAEPELTRSSFLIEANLLLLDE